MKRALQYSLLGLYKLVSATGIFGSRWGRAFFDWTYLSYKALFEAGDIRVLASLIPRGTVVIDVGANIGFFTRRFAQWVGETGKVIAIEPEEVNMRRLNHMVARQHLGNIVEAIQAVAVERAGILKLKLNPMNPGDHRIANEGVSVRAVCLDDLLAERQWPRTSLIKIDVQGAEERVLLGARQLLEKQHPALFIEIDDPILRSMGSSGERILHQLTDSGYGIHRIQGRQISTALSVSEALSLCQDGGYTDFLFLYRN
jgi:FkbM family methyltransferase